MLKWILKCAQFEQRRARERDGILAIDRKFFHSWCTCPIIQGVGRGAERTKVWKWIFDRFEVIRRLFVWRENCCRSISREWKWNESLFLSFKSLLTSAWKYNWKLWKYGVWFRDFCMHKMLRLSFYNLLYILFFFFRITMIWKLFNFVI